MRKKTYCHYCSNRLVDKFYEGRVRLFCERCNEPIYENPIPATCLLVFDAQNKLLLVKRSVDPKKGLWCLPGGFMELGETPEQCALRELKEETGLTGEMVTLHGVAGNPSSLYHTVAIVGYIVNKYTGIIIPGDDAEEVCYFAPESLPHIAFDTHLHFIRKYYANPALPDT